MLTVLYSELALITSTHYTKKNATLNKNEIFLLVCSYRAERIVGGPNHNSTFWAQAEDSSIHNIEAFLDTTSSLQDLEATY